MQEGKIYDMAVVETIRSLRTVKRQLMLLKSAPIGSDERKKLLAAIESVQEEFKIFKM